METIITRRSVVPTEAESGGKILGRIRHVPLVRNTKIRTLIGFLLLVLSVVVAWKIHGAGYLSGIAFVAVFAWLISVLLTDKYVHKYPQRYFPYLFASHLKAAIVMALLLAFFLWIMSRVGMDPAVPRDVLWTGFFLFVIMDALVSVPRRRQMTAVQPTATGEVCKKDEVPDDRFVVSAYSPSGISSIDPRVVMGQICSEFEEPLIGFLQENLPDLNGIPGSMLISADTTLSEERIEPVGLLVSRVRINDVRRINRFFLSCAKRITMGGFFVGRYIPLEQEAQERKRRYTGFLYPIVFMLHFLWYRAFPKIPWLNAIYFSVTKGRNRVLSKVEIWGRLSYCGMRVIAESTGGGEKYLIAQRVSDPVQNKRPSYYPIVALEKVGLDGQIVRTHKIRTMFPFSEFLQKRIFEDHGLAPTGKFANDFRLTEYGKFLRKYWLDELPQIFDWLRGEVKLFGMRATSRHYLSLYPRELYDLYIQVKPGLIPPIFDESTSGLEKIAEVELTYLRRYREQPIRTDVRYLIRTFTDIVFRGVRSK